VKIVNFTAKFLLIFHKPVFNTPLTSNSISHRTHKVVNGELLSF